MVEIVHHELHDLRVIAEVVGGIAGIAIDRLELDSTGFSFLAWASDKSLQSELEHHTMKLSFLNAASKYPECPARRILWQLKRYGPQINVQPEKSPET
jgi:hypothetical protein